jgi:pyroglutamyl-peptidase
LFNNYYGARKNPSGEHEGSAVVTVVQGFGPFADHPVNPSEVLVHSLAERYAADNAAAARPVELVSEVLDVSRDRVVAGVRKLMEQHRPQVWLGVGLAAGRTALSLEAVAVNLADWPEDQADVDGLTVAREPVVDSGPAAHATTLPVEAILGTWKEAGIPGYLSLSAGSYLCNLSFFAAAQAAEELGIACRVGFLHVPLLPELVTKPDRQPSMALPLQQAGLDLVLDACRTPTDGAGLYLRGTA